jgi:broad specificity phosphatase PhoE
MPPRVSGRSLEGLSPEGDDPRYEKHERAPPSRGGRQHEGDPRQGSDRPVPQAAPRSAWQTLVMPVLLIRHADAGSRRDWSGTERERGLSKKGRRQADALTPVVEKYAPARLLSSPYRRCVDTLQPSASATGLVIEVCDELAEGKAEEALKLVRSLAGEDVAMCTHGDVIPEVLTALADEDRLDLGPEPRQAKGSVWVLESSGDRFVGAEYLAPSS